MSYWNKRAGFKSKKNNNWNQSLKSTSTTTITKKRIRKSLQYLLILKKFDNVIDYTNIKLLSAFLNRYGKIKPRRKTRLSIQQQRSVAKAIRKARAHKLLPYVCDVKG
jgi:ribosomal protein S18